MGDRAQALLFYNKAIESLSNKDDPKHQEHALHLFSSACMCDPDFGEGFHQLGNVHSEFGHLHAAIANWRRALQCQDLPKHIRPQTMQNLSWRLHGLGHVDEALALGLASVELDPNLFQGWITLSCIYQTLADGEKEYETAARAYDLLPGDPLVQIQMAFAGLYSRRLAEGFKHFESRFAYKLKSYLQLPYPKWNGEPDQTIFLDADQGLGDTVSFARFVHLAAKRCRYIHLYVQPELRRLFEHAFNDLLNVNVVGKPAPFPEADAWTTFVSLPTNLGLSDDEIRNTPHIDFPRYGKVVNWRVPGRKLHVGVAWSGSPFNDINAHRSFHVTQLFDLTGVPGVQLYSLQIGQGAQDLYDHCMLSLIRDLNPEVRDVCDSLRVLKGLDLVITCESALWHIAQLAGVETWVPYSYLGRDWRLGLDGSDAFWAPNLRVFRQHKGETWAPVFARIAKELERRVK